MATTQVAFTFPGRDERPGKSADFDDAVASVEAGFDPWPGCAERRQEHGSSAVPKAHPDDFDFRVALLGEVNKTFVLADDDPPLSLSVAADVAVAGVA